ncbi:hypothetical protein [Acetobacter sp. AAB5]|uniref:hypothetical protein n=1 Tax=Acetobacter sp. AAB5 TaxID=3418370 RepID=UPI003CFB2AA2
MKNFNVHRLKGVIFPLPDSHQGDFFDEWGKIWSDIKPTSFQQMASHPFPQSRGSAVMEGLLVTLTIQPGRVEVMVEAVPFEASASQESSDAPPRILKINDALDLLSDSMKKICQIHQPVRVSQILDSTKSVEKIDQLPEVMRICKNVSPPPGTSDLMIRFNVPRKFKSNRQLEMNRVCTIVAGKQLIMVSSAVLKGGIPEVSESSREKYFVGVKFDFNSAADNIQPIEASDEILEEILSEIKKIFTGGIDELAE